MGEANTPGTIDVRHVTLKLRQVTTPRGDSALAAWAFANGNAIGSLELHDGPYAVVQVLPDGSEAVVKWVDGFSAGCHFLQHAELDWRGQERPAAMTFEKPDAVFKRLRVAAAKASELAEAIRNDAVALRMAVERRRKAKKPSGAMTPRVLTGMVLVDAHAIHDAAAALSKDMSALAEKVE